MGWVASGSNTSLVRLKRVWLRMVIDEEKFQYLIGSIETLVSVVGSPLSSSFQYLIGSIETGVF